MVSAPERLHLDPAELMPRAIGRYTPLVVDHGRGLYVWDTAGDRYADYTSGIGVVNTGHCHPRVVEAIREQAGKIIHAQANILAHEPMLNAARALTSTLPASLNQVFWTNSGAEATEGALKLAKIATGRPAIIAFRGAFHGRTHAAMSVTSSRVKVRGHYEPLLPSVYFAPYPYLFRSPYKGSPEEQDLRYFAELEEMFDQLVMPDDVAAMLIETVAGEGGYMVPTARWLRMVRELCDKHGIMLILDEVQSGMGRTGTMWAFEHFGIVPDIMTVAKGIASGMPVAAVVADKAIMDKWMPGSHGGTYGGNAVGTAAALATLEVMRDENLPGNAARMGEVLLAGLREIQADHPVIGDVRGLGLMVATEFVHPDGSPNPEAVKAVVAKAMDENVILITCGTYDQAIRIIPPLIVSEEEIRDFLTMYRRAVASV
ncbi:MAG TPA: aminotransferase class III-fold pyridoxal phosphate-dependent enzyme [Thermomicrobiales bacterium]|nr:aminotransferase class III-fold pyridoxal phosphate-dependent enzyme [Thermomicrobiales bacterium]